MAEVAFKTKILLSDTLREIPLRGELTIKSSMFKTATVRSTAYKLKKEGFLFEVSDKGRIDDTIVIRLK